jgi:transcriptional regulator with XRE-family HTH domain
MPIINFEDYNAVLKHLLIFFTKTIWLNGSGMNLMVGLVRKKMLLQHHRLLQMINEMHINIITIVQKKYFLYYFNYPYFHNRFPIIGKKIYFAEHNINAIMNLNNKTALKIKEARESKNISQTALAKELSISGSAYSRLENGEVQITLNILELLAEKLDLQVVELLGINTSQVNHFNNGLAQSVSGTINITLPAEEFQKIYSKIKEEGQK